MLTDLLTRPDATGGDVLRPRRRSRVPCPARGAAPRRRRRGDGETFVIVLITQRSLVPPSTGHVTALGGKAAGFPRWWLGWVLIILPPPAEADHPTRARAAGAVAVLTRQHGGTWRHSYVLGPSTDAVVPVSYAVKGGRHAADLWLYKSDMAGASAARAFLQALLLVFLRDHARCVWQYAAMPPPTRVAVVPSGQGRPGAHPLLSLFSPYLVLPRLAVAVRPGEPPGRALNPRRFTVGRGAAGESVLLLDDTWVSGASAQSAAVALRMAGARHVAVVVLGRHINPADPRARRLTWALEAAPYDPRACAVHGACGHPDGPPVYGWQQPRGDV